MWKVDISICGGGRSTLASKASCLVHLPAGHSRYWTGHGNANSGKVHTAPEMRKLININLRLLLQYNSIYKNVSKIYGLSTSCSLIHLL